MKLSHFEDCLYCVRDICSTLAGFGILVLYFVLAGILHTEFSPDRREGAPIERRGTEAPTILVRHLLEH